MNQIIRENTLEYRFERSKERPGQMEVYEWLAGSIGITASQVDAIQLDPVANAAYVYFKSEQIMEETFQKTGDKTTCVTKKGVTHEIEVKRCDEKRHYIRIINFSAREDNNHIRDALKQYGEVESIRDETMSNPVFPSIKTGVRIATMILKKDIPSSIRIKGMNVVVAYRGQPKTCSMCNSAEHLRSACPKLKQAQERFTKFREHFTQSQSEQFRPNYEIKMNDLYREPSNTASKTQEKTKEQHGLNASQETQIQTTQENGDDEMPESVKNNDSVAEVTLNAEGEEINGEDEDMGSILNDNHMDSDHETEDMELETIDNQAVNPESVEPLSTQVKRPGDLQDPKQYPSLQTAKKTKTKK